MAESSRRDDWFAQNYCLGFIDLLGQREAVRGQQLLPAFANEHDKKAFMEVVRSSVAKIHRLQTYAETMLDEIVDRRNSPFRERLPAEQRPIWDAMQRKRIAKQHWSDGLVVFAALGDQEIKCPMNGVFDVLALCGALCFLGLATGQPVRGGIDIAWGLELRPGELYGPVVARAYELESEVAQYPRIVLGAELTRFLKAHAGQPENDLFATLNATLARKCLNMIVQDFDGVEIVDYLGTEFRDAVTQAGHPEMFEKAHEFVRTEFERHQAEGNIKLASRYKNLLNYFVAHASAEKKT